VCALAALTISLAPAQQPQRITPNFKDADITQIAEAVSAATGKNFIIDPRVRAQVTSQDPAGRQRAPDPLHRPARPRQRHLGRDRHAGGGRA
jgi:type II secretory pathway component GspD/PulD (secretin)